MSIRLTSQGAVVSYHLPRSGDMTMLGPVSFTVEPGQFVSVVGPSGCGKSTLLRLLAGLQMPTNGRMLIGEVPITGPSRRVAVMFQEANLMPWRTVLDNIALPLELEGQPKTQRYETVRSLLPRLGLADFEAAFPAELSGGMAQRVALGRVLIQRPSAMLLDEPFGALDALTREQISLDLIRLWEQENTSVVMVTHDLNEAVLLSDRVLVLSPRPGRLLADIPVTLPRPRDIYSAAFGAVARQVRALIDTGAGEG
jgi:NitT/TauT family transport system ATP-binding protein